jgi:hypothetical protein
LAPHQYGCGAFLTLQYEIINNFYIMNNCKFLPLNKENISLSPEEAEKLVREDCNSFLKTKQGFHYLMMKYPHLSVSQAVNEYIKNALWIDSIV